MRTIFICYPREQAEDHASRGLADDLRRHFGNQQVFRDQENIGGGESWKKRVLSEIDKDSAVLILIGQDWLTRKDERGRGLNDPTYPVRMEIADALRDGALLIPVLCDGAPMPRDDQLPEEISAFAELIGLRLRKGDWETDVGQICGTLERAGWRPARRGAPLKLIVAYALIVFATIGYLSFVSAANLDPGMTKAVRTMGFVLVAIIYATASVASISAYRNYQRGLSAHGRSAMAGIVIALVGGSICAISAFGNEPEAEAKEPARAEIAPVIQGRWTTADGESFEFEQEGVLLTAYRSLDGQRAKCGAGVFIEGSADLDVSLPGGGLGKLRLGLSQDAKKLEGTLTTPAGGEQRRVFERTGR